MADHLYIRYHFRSRNAEPVPKAVWCEVLWVEWKARGGKLSQAQINWHRQERARGAVTLIAKIEFECTITGFCEFYAASGLQRKSISIPRS